MQGRNVYVEFFNGDELPLMLLANRAGLANRVPTDEEAEAMAALESMRAIKEHLQNNMPVNYKVVGYDGHIHIACPDDHPPIVLPLYPAKNNKLSVAARAKIVCPVCTKAADNPNVIVGFLCRYHPDVILKRGMNCEKCEDNGLATALNGEKITLLNTGRLREYQCPMHGKFELPSQRQKVECPSCTSLDGVNAYAATIQRDNKEELKRLKAVAKPIMRAALKSIERHGGINSQKIAMINALAKRCYEPEENMHLLAIFPTTAFVKGEWLATHKRQIEVALSQQEYLMPSPQALVDATESNKTAIINDAVVLCDSAWRTAHWSRHKEFV